MCYYAKLLGLYKKLRRKNEDGELVVLPRSIIKQQVPPNKDSKLLNA